MKLAARINTLALSAVLLAGPVAATISSITASPAAVAMVAAGIRGAPRAGRPTPAPTAQATATARVRLAAAPLGAIRAFRSTLVRS